MATSTRPGDVLAGRYRLIDLLSESGGGRFWRAHDRVLERYVALHVIAEDDPRAPLLLEAARSSATVLDPRILRVLDAEARDGLCFVVNEWGTGTSLDILVRHGGPLGPRRSAWLAADVAGAVAKAHSAGVAHGRLNPENVLIDRFGAVRLIGLCVDAALHGLPSGRFDQDRRDLGGLLYCALTATWPGPSTSEVPEAPREHGHVLPPRRVRAGVPRPLDQLWCHITEHNHRRRRHGSDVDVSSATAIGERLLEYLGDPTGLPEALAASIPPINDVRPVVLPAVPEPLPHDADEPVAEPVAPPTEPVEPPTKLVAPDEPEVEPEPATEQIDPASTERGKGQRPAAPRGVVDIPTEAGMPVFDDDEDVSWLRARSTPPPPPPPFEDPPERPLFAPDPPEGAPVRRPRTDVPPPREPSPPPVEPAAGGPGYWPWDTTGHPGLTAAETAEHEPVPGRNWFRLGMVLVVTLLLLFAVVVAFNLGRGRTPLGQEREEDAPTSTASPTTAPPSPIGNLVASDFDPLADPPEENPSEAPLAVDGDPATAWSTSTYDDQLGPPPGLKTGVGLLLDLGARRQVSSVDLTFIGAPTTVSLYVFDEQPTAAPTGDPIASDTADGEELTLGTAGPDDADPAIGRYLVVWLTALPDVGGFRGEVAEVVVHGN